MKHSFSILLGLCVLMLVGLFLIPHLDISEKPPTREGKVLSVRYFWLGTSAEVIEQNVTSVIEGLASSLNGVKEVSSYSYYGSGRVTIVLKPETDVAYAKFELSTLLRQIYRKLPEGVSYPILTGGDAITIGSYAPLLLTYQINAPMSLSHLEAQVKQTIKPLIENIEGVHQVKVSGGIRQCIEIVYDVQLLKNYQLNVADIEEAIRVFIGKKEAIGSVIEPQNDESQTRITLLLTTEQSPYVIDTMPIKRIGDRIIRLNHIARCYYRDEVPTSYYRVNGMNTISVNIWAKSGRRLSMVSDRIKLLPIFNENGSDSGMYYTKLYDKVEQEQQEFYVLLKRSLASVCLLLVLVWLIKRDWKYLTIVFITLLSTYLLSVIAFWGLNVCLHPISLAGITISLGLVVDAAIVMTDSYGRYRNWTVVSPIIAAFLTTIASLVVVFCLSDQSRHNLYDFFLVILICLSSALLIAVLAVPALVERFTYDAICKKQAISRPLLNKWNRFYSAYIFHVQKRKWLYIIIIVLAFGLPIHLLPNRMESDGFGKRLYNSVLGSNFYRDKCKEPVSKVLGGSLRLFSKALYANRADEIKETRLYIRGRMPQGSSVSEFNQKMLMVESFLSGVKGIRRFETRINENGGQIVVEFTEEAIVTQQCYEIESQVIARLISIGGADWSTRGVSERGFSNALGVLSRSESIELVGYHYAQLYRYAEEVCRHLEQNIRVTDISIEVPGFEQQGFEYYMTYNRPYMVQNKISPTDVHRELRDLLTEKSIGRLDNDLKSLQLKLSPSEKETFDLWQLENSHIIINQNDSKLSDYLFLAKRSSKTCIVKRDQEYVLKVAFNMNGSYYDKIDYLQRVREEINHQLPIGFYCQRHKDSWRNIESENYWLIVIIASIILVMCAVVFENLRQAFSIIMLIPTSLIGFFLVYYWSGVPFGKGGLAAMILLCGVSVNAGIYLMYEYNCLCQKNPSQVISNGKAVNLYIKAYHHKIVPIVLTIITSMVGLVPFLFDSTHHSFWFSFAVGSIGGLISSLLALVFVFPLFIRYKTPSQAEIH